ncbi:MAG: single-strand DNA-binding protein [Candidatus Paceibacteria bacterium]|jgi:single-strand DNA-binding protein
MYLNKATIIGNLTRDPELKTLPSGIKVTSFSLATNRVWMKDGQKQEAVDYHNVVVFGRQAETSAQYLKKGSQAMVLGRMQTRSWDDAGSGKKMYRTEVVADSVQFGRRPEGVANMAPTTENPVEAPAAPAMDTIEYPEEDINPEDIPF